MTAPTVTVLVRNVTAMSDDTRVEAVSLDEALAREWPTDAHFVAYEPRTVPVEGEDRRALVRLLHEEHDERPAVYEVLDVLDVPNVRMVALVGDIDAPEKRPTPEWRDDVRARLEAAELAYYETRGGFRTLATIDFTIASRYEAAAWTDLYVGWCEHLEATHGLKLDRACKDWTRLYRLPNVNRGGKRERSTVVGTIRAWRREECRAVASTAKATAQRAATTRDGAALERARAMAERLQPSVENHEGDKALMIAARELATVLDGDADAIESVLVDTFNPRCLPAWDGAKLKREAGRAAARHAKKANDPLTKALKRRAEREPTLDGNVGDRLDHAIGRVVDLDTPITAVRYLVESLGIAWAGKVAAIHGYAGTSKGFLLALVALHVASGTALFGKPVARVPVLYVDAETEPLASNRMKRLALGMGIDLGTLQRDGWIRFIDAHGDLTSLTPAIAAELEKLDRGNGALVCIDSYSSLVSGDEIKSEYADPMWELGKALRQVNAVSLVVMHDRKSPAMPNAKASALEGISGTNRLAASLVTSIKMTRDDESNECRLLVTSTRAPEKKFAPFYLTWTDRDDGAIVATVEATVTAASGKTALKEDFERRVEHYITAIERELRDSYDKDPGAAITAAELRRLCSGKGDGSYAEAVSRCQYKRKSIAREPGRGSSLLYRATPSVAVSVGGKFERRVVTPSKMAGRERAALDATVARLATKKGDR